MIEYAGLVTGRELTARIANAPSRKRVVVRPSPGEGLIVTGNIEVNRPDVRIERVELHGVVTFDTHAENAVLKNSKATGFDILGADHVLIENNRFDGLGERNQNVVWDKPAGNTPDHWIIRGNSFHNFYKSGTHSEALFIGYSTNGLIENNVFTNNGNTAHIFFSYCGAESAQKDGCRTYPGTYPRDICVRDNTFNRTYVALFDIQFRKEIPFDVANIRTQPGASTTEPQLAKKC